MRRPIRKPRTNRNPSRKFTAGPPAIDQQRLSFLQMQAVAAIANAEVWPIVFNAMPRLFPDWPAVWAEYCSLADDLTDIGLHTRWEHLDMAMRNRLVQGAYALGVIAGLQGKGHAGGGR
jgi:hypothetical protein